MGGIVKFLFIFLCYGAAWYLIFAIPLKKDDCVFLAIQRSVRSLKGIEKIEVPNKPIQKEKVIDALTHAFDK